tara:strand:- start:2840 stop:3625 length:786 start_codon:yes stop_codon:yes gene_type:complete
VVEKVLGVIPARYQSSRFPGKPLVEIMGVPMIKRTFLQASKSRQLNDLVIATDSDEIANYCKVEKMPYVMTSKDCLTGTDRVAEVSFNMAFDLYVNIQGDEPVIDPAGIDQVVELFRVHGDSYAAFNLYKFLEDQTEIESDSIVKVITNELDEVMYMSRLPVPFSKSGLQQQYRQQVPVYAYTKEALDLFSASDKTINEKYEDVELLRFVDMGKKIKMAPTTVSTIAVDFPEDVKKVESFLRASNSINEANFLANKKSFSG